MMSIVSQGLVPFAQFMETLRTARAEEYLNLPHSAVLDENAFNEMRAYLLRYYDGVSPSGSFGDPSGSVFDSIPVEQQLSLRGRCGSVAAPPNLPGNSPYAYTPSPSQVGNETCTPGTIPVRRLTLEDLSRFPTLGHFFRKAPNSREASKSR
jgi:hypothetical protein